MRRFILTLGLIFSLLPVLAAAQEFVTAAKQAALLDLQTGSTLFAKAADERMGPSSMSKMMTVYLLLEQIKQGVVSLDQEFTVSEKAWRMGGSKMFVRVNTAVKVEDLLRGIIVQSGNDACVVVAEALDGSEEAFARRMNAKAEELGLSGSHFANSTGWPDEQHYMTAQDLAKLARALIRDFPEYYHYWAEREFTYNDIRQPNRNALLGELGIDGLKTGHTEAAGYGITVSGEQDGRRLVAVVNGLTSEKERLEEARRLMTYGFNHFENVEVVKAGQTVGEAQSWLGEKPVPLVAGESVTLSMPKLNRDKVLVRAVYQEPIPAPVEKGAEVGALEINVPGNEAQRYPLFAGESVAKLGPAERIVPVLKYRLFGTY